MNRVLVTGATGFLGAAIVKLLRARGQDVVGTTTGAAGELLVRLELTDAASVAAGVASVAPDVIIHSAAISSVTAGKPLDYYRVNTVGTEYLLSAAARMGHPCRFLFISTAGVYGNQDAEVLSEDLPPQPVHHYGMSKFCAERVVHNFADSLEYTIVRPFNVVGSGQDESFIAPKLVAAFAANEPEIRLGNIDVYRDYLDLETACELICDLAFTGRAAGETVNLCSGIGTSLKELLAIMERIAGYDIKVIQDPAFMRKSEVWKLLGSRAKLDEVMGRRIEPRPLENALRGMFEAKRRELGAN